ncbi:tubulointerstitial nephritis antigen-like [Trichonephila clavipes]|nr:tubulointerstitial nephritis antigen-like [Trichonephila clavipes]
MDKVEKCLKDLEINRWKNMASNRSRWSKPAVLKSFFFRWAAYLRTISRGPQKCLYQGRYYNLGYVLKINCNTCTCRIKGTAKFEFECEQNVCLVRQELLTGINDARQGWKASNYSFLWGKTLEEGIQYRLGTFKPLRPTMEMTEIHQITNGPLPASFDSRQKWRNLITPIRDQGIADPLGHFHLQP